MYFISQIFVVLGYIFLAITYMLKRKSYILQVSLLSLFATLLGYAFLSAYAGMLMMFVSICRNIIFWIREDKLKKDNNIFILLFLYLLIVLLTMYAYDGLFSLLPMFGTMTYTYSVWQSNYKVYRILGVPTCIFYVFYNIFVKSFFGVILESLLAIWTIINSIKYRKKEIYCK